MARSFLALALMLAFAMPSWAYKPRTRNSPSTQDMSCVLYSLADLGNDANLGKFIADTIPDVIQPATWNQAGGDGKLNYFPAGKVLVIYQTPAGHGEVDTFLKHMKKALAQDNQPTQSARPAMNRQTVVPAQFTAPNTLQISDPAPVERMPYPVPAQIKQPKHLFHFIIRYEGDGVIDANVADYLKTMVRQQGLEEAALEIIRRNMPVGYLPSVDCSVGAAIVTVPPTGQPVVPAGFLLPTLRPGHPGHGNTTPMLPGPTMPPAN